MDLNNIYREGEVYNRLISCMVGEVKCTLGIKHNKGLVCLYLQVKEARFAGEYIFIRVNMRFISR